MRRLPLFAPLVAALPAAAAAGVRAADPAEARPLARLLALGPVAVVSDRPDGGLAQITLFRRVAAQPETLCRVVASFGDYPSFMPSFQAVTPAGEQDGEKLYDWELDVPLFDFEGRVGFRAGCPRSVSVRTLGGDVKDGSYEWRFSPDGGGTLASLSVYADVRRSSWFVRKLIERSPEMEHATVLGTALVQTEAIAAEAEKRSGIVRPPRSRDRGPGREPTRDLGEPTPEERVALGRLFARGEVAVIQSWPGGRLRQATVMKRAAAPPERVRELVVHPGRWHEFIPAIVKSDVRSETPDEIVYALEIDVPLFNLDIVNRMERRDGRIGIVVLEGDIHPGRYSWEVHPAPGGTLLVNHLSSDVAAHNFVLRSIRRKSPYFEHGANVATGLVAVRAMAREAQKK